MTYYHLKRFTVFVVSFPQYPTIPPSAQLKKLGLEEQRRQMIFEAFEFFDTDHNGTLEFGEIMYAMQILGYPTSEIEVQHLIDTKGEDESVGFDDFTDFVLSKMVWFFYIPYIFHLFIIRH